MKNNPKVIRAWCMYDWANSAHALVIVSAIFPDYFVGVATFEKTPYVNLFGYLVKNSVVFSYTIALAYTFIVLLNPFLIALADYSGKKKTHTVKNLVITNLLGFIIWASPTTYGRIHDKTMSESIQIANDITIMADLGFNGWKPKSVKLLLPHKNRTADAATQH